MPKETIVQRLTTVIEDDSLLAPEWCELSKNYLINEIKKALVKEGFVY